MNIIQQGRLSDEEVLHQILVSAPDAVGFSSMSYDFPSVCKMIEKLPSVLILIGGSHISIASEQLPERQNCFGVMGEGELTVLELLQGGDVSKINGICYWQNGELIVKPPRGRIQDLDSLPFGIESAEIVEKPFVGKFMFPTVANQKSTELTVAQRGCPFNCQFCASQYVWHREVV